MESWKDAYNEKPNKGDHILLHIEFRNKGSSRLHEDWQTLVYFDHAFAIIGRTNQRSYEHYRITHWMKIPNITNK